MTEPNETKSNSLWIALAVFLVLGLGAVFLLLGPSDPADEEEDTSTVTVATVENQEPFVLGKEQVRLTVPSDAEVLVLANMQQVLRSPILSMMNNNRERILNRLRMDPRVKTFLEGSGVSFDQGKHLTLIMRGLAERPKSPHVVAEWKGRFDAAKVTQSFREATGAKDSQIAGKNVVADEALALHAEKALIVGNRPLFDDFIAGKDGFKALPQVKELMANLGKQGAITVFGRITKLPNVKVPLVPVEKIKWVAATIEVMGAPKVRLVALTGSADEAKEMESGIEAALGLGSLALSAKGGADAVVKLIERIKLSSNGKAVILSVDVPMSEVPALMAELPALIKHARGSIR